MTDINRIVRMLRVSESDLVQEEAADALEAQALRVKELEVPLCIGKRTIGIMAEEGMWQSENGRAVVAADELFRRDPYARIAELEAALRPFAFREEIELTLENGAYPVKAIVVFKDEREAALKLLKGTKE